MQAHRTTVRDYAEKHGINISRLAPGRNHRTVYRQSESEREKRSREMAAKMRQKRNRKLILSTDELAALTRQCIESKAIQVTKCPPGIHAGWRPKWF
jgi:hypothetical protein